MSIIILFLAKLCTDIPHADAMYPVTLKQFQKYTNVEEFLIKEWISAGPDTYRICNKFRRSYISFVYRRFYSDEAERNRLFKFGLEIKPAPKSLKDRIMLMPEGKFKDLADP